MDEFAIFKGHRYAIQCFGILSALLMGRSGSAFLLIPGMATFLPPFVF